MSAVLTGVIAGLAALVVLWLLVLGAFLFLIYRSDKEAEL